MAVFGRTPWGIHVGHLLVNAATILLVFAVGRRLLGEFEGAASAVVFALLTLDRWVYGMFAHATHFVVLAAMAGLLLLLRAFDQRRATAYAWSGLAVRRRAHHEAARRGLPAVLRGDHLLGREPSRAARRGGSR